MKQPSTSTRGLRKGWLSLLLGCVLSSSHASAEEVTKQMCVDSHLKAQSQRLEGRLVESRRSLQTCANQSCPDIVQRDCVKWLEDLRGQVPTVIFEATDENGALRDVTVTHAGQVLAASINGTALEINPGTYDFVFETRDGRSWTETVLVRQGDRNRPIVADFSEHHEPDNAWILRVPPSARVTGAVTVVATTVAVGFGASALIRQSNALESCAPGCSNEVSRRVATRLTIADAATGVAVVSGLATLVLVARASGEQRPVSSARVSPVLGVSARSAFLAVKGAF